MRKILLMVLLILSITSISFADEIKDTPTDLDSFNFTLIPYEGGIGVNLGSLYYPRHVTKNGTVTWVKWDGTENIDYYTSSGVTYSLPSAFRPTESGSYSSVYSDMHIIGLGGAYNIPIGDNVSIEALGLSGVDIERDGITLTVSAICDSNFEFVSQSNPIYRRPFKIEIFPRIRISDNAGIFANPDPYTEKVYEIDSTTGPIQIDIPNANEVSNPALNGTKYVTMLAADMVLVLPYDYANHESGGGYFSGGLTYENATYPLADLNDYTAIVTLEIQLTIEYEKDGVPGSVSQTRILTIPFSGYYASNGDGAVRNDSISLFVNATEEAANLDLSRQGEWITVGNIQFLYNDGTYRPSGYKNSDIVKLFLSASPYPTVQSSSEFRMVHEDASSVLTNTNSIGFTARIEGTDPGVNDISLVTTSNTVDFDGTEYTGNIAYLTDQNEVINSDHDAVVTSCNMGVVSNIMDGHNNEYSWGKEYLYRHFHTFEGDIQIRFDRSDMLQAGIYRGYIYVHAVTEDEK